MTLMTKPDRDIKKLQTPFQYKVQLRLEKAGKLVFITEARRTKERQAELYAQWRTKPWKIITMTLKSKHVDWVAIDFWFLGKVLYPPTKDPVWEQVTNLGKAFGMNRGGDWEKFKDFPHMEDNWLTLEQQLKVNSALYNKTTNISLQNALHVANESIRLFLASNK